MAWLALRQIGGQTGDVLGGAEQVAETAILVLLAARLARRDERCETNLWLIRHAPVDGPRGVIHGPDAPADLSDAAAFAALQGEDCRRARSRFAARRAGRGRPRASAGARCRSNRAAFREQDFGAWTGRRHDDLAPNSAPPIANSGNRRRATGRPAAKVLSIRSRAQRRACAAAAGRRVLVVHSGTIRAVLAIALDLEPEQALRFVIDPLSLTRIDRLDGRLARRRGQPAFEGLGL